jgi:hypothetical protein
MILSGTKPSGEPLIDKDEGRWSNWEVKFHHRFLPFAELSNPPTLTYGDFLRATGQGAPATTEAGSSSSGGSAAAAVAPRVRDPAVLGNLVQGASVCFQNARKVFDEARIGTLGGGALAAEGADRYALTSVVSLTKVCSCARVCKLLYSSADCLSLFVRSDRCRWRARCPR